MKQSTRQVTVIGIFVVIAIALLVGLLMTLGGNKWARDVIYYRMRFTTSVKGLNIGAPVMFRGVSIGEVDRINLAPQEQHAHEKQDETSIQEDALPVEIVVKIFPEKLGYYDKSFFKFLPHSSENAKQAHQFLGAMVLNHQMRAQLETLSLLTGQIYISLNVFNKPLGEPEGMIEQLWLQNIIPSRLSFLERLSSNVDENGLGKRIASFQTLTRQIAKFVDDGGAEQFMQDLSRTTGNLAVISGDMREKLPELLARVQEISAKLDKAMVQVNGSVDQMKAPLAETIDDARKFVGSLNGLLEESKPDVQNLLATLRQTADTAQQDLTQLNDLLAILQTEATPGSPTREHLEDSLKECDKLLSELHAFLELLNRNPQALLLGR